MLKRQQVYRYLFIEFYATRKFADTNTENYPSLSFRDDVSKNPRHAFPVLEQSATLATLAKKKFVPTWKT